MVLRDLDDHHLGKQLLLLSRFTRLHPCDSSSSSGRLKPPAASTSL
jgi:hypothetical protein